MLEWTEKLSVSVPEMDEQHRQWIDLINKLERAVTEGHANDVIDHVSTELIDFSKHHFAEEERMLEQKRYPALEQHKGIHREFMAKLDHIAKTSGLKSYQTAQTLAHMKGWLIAHVMEHDKAYGAYLNR